MQLQGIVLIQLQGNDILVNPKSLEEKIVTRSHERGQSIGPLPFYLCTVLPIDMKLSTHNKLHLYFQFSETTSCLIGFHVNNSQTNDITGGASKLDFKFSNFVQIFPF